MSVKGKAEAIAISHSYKSGEYQPRSEGKLTHGQSTNL